MAEQCKLRTNIENFVKDAVKGMLKGGMMIDAQGQNHFYGFYFNYDLNCHTWRLLVNK